MSNLNGMGPFNDPNWVCRKGAGGGNYGRGGGRGGGFRRFAGGCGAGYRAAFQGGYAPDQRPVEAGVDRSSEINALKEKIAALEETVNSLKADKGEL